MRRLTLGWPLPNHRTLDGSLLSWRHGGIIGNVTDGPKSGILIAADPATVERSGFAIGFRLRPARRLHGAIAADLDGTGKATGVAS